MSRSKWGKETLKASNKKVEKDMFDMYRQLGDDNPKGKDGKPLTAEEFHGASSDWQKYNSNSFRSAFNRVKKLVGKF